MFNTKKARLAAVLFVMGTALCAPQAMALGLGDLMGGGAASSADPDAFVKSAQSAEKLMNDSRDGMFRALVSKSESAKYEAQLKAANALTPSVEKDAKIIDLKKNEDALLNEALSGDKLKANIKQMDSKHREELGASAFNFALALLQDRVLIEQSTSLISSLSSNPMNLLKLGGIKDVASSLSNQVSSAGQIAGKMPDVFMAVGVKAPTSKDDKPKVVAEASGE